MEKIFIKNRKGQNISVIVEKHPDQKGVAFVMHGLGGFKEQPHLQVMADAFKEKGFTVVRFDTTNTFGESDGKYEDATITNYYEDLEDVIMWAEKQAWFTQPLVLSGHSLGGICTALYAEKYPEKVFALAPTSPVVSGKLSYEAHEKDGREDLEHWKKTGWHEKESLSKPGVMKRLPWTHMLDRLKYDLLPDASKLTMPTLLIVGALDASTPPDHVKILYDVLPGKKELRVIEGAPHTFRAEKDLETVKTLFLQWIDGLGI